jgi:hypothetical protein
MRMICLLIWLLPFATFAQSVFELSEEELNPEPEDALTRRREQYLRNESMIYDLDTGYGVRDQRRYTGSDRNRLSFAGHLNGDYERITDILGVDFSYQRRSTRYHQAWWGMQFFAHNTFFNTISMNPQRGSESQFQRPRNVQNTLWGIGPGAGYRFKLLLDFFETENVFESVDVYLNFLELNESYTQRLYRGYGLSTNYGIHKRVNTNFFWGGKFSYNIGSVARPAIESESRGQRSLTLGWMSYALEFGFFY